MDGSNHAHRGRMLYLRMAFSRTLGSAVLGLTAIVITGCSLLEQPEGPLAPPFSGMDRFYKKPGDNRDQPKSMLDLTRNGRLIMVFMHGECPLSLGALARAKQIADAAPKNDIRVIGVIAQSIEEYAAWAPYSFPAAPVIADPDRKIIQNYGITKSPSFQVIGRKGSLLEKVEGWTLETDTQLQKALGISLSTPKIPRGEGRSLMQ